MPHYREYSKLKREAAVSVMWERVMATPVEIVPLDALAFSHTPRLKGQNIDHVNTLAECSGEWPPIIVHKSTMSVIDGMHRTCAAAARGEDSIAARLHDCSDSEAFILAVSANVEHGLPLSMQERTIAAERIISSNPDWSDRTIGAASGLSAKTIATLRERLSDGLPDLTARVGRDGRRRPLSSAEGRRIAGRLFEEDPKASLRQVAKQAGISLGTAQDVRARISRHEDPVPQRERSVAAGKEAGAVRRPAAVSLSAAVGLSNQNWTSDVKTLSVEPNLRYSLYGRRVLRLLVEHTAIALEWDAVIDAIPDHCVSRVAAAAERCAELWGYAARRLASRLPQDSGGDDARARLQESGGCVRTIDPRENRILRLVRQQPIGL